MYKLSYLNDVSCKSELLSVNENRKELKRRRIKNSKIFFIYHSQILLLNQAINKIFFHVLIPGIFWKKGIATNTGMTQLSLGVSCSKQLCIVGSSSVSYVSHQGVVVIRTLPKILHFYQHGQLKVLTHHPTYTHHTQHEIMNNEQLLIEIFKIEPCCGMRNQLCNQR